MKLLFRNPAYRILTLSRFFNAFGASIFNLVFIVYASTLSQPQLFTPNLKTIQNPCLSLDPGWFLFS
ncbi:hypothetical protein RKY35_09060, partial [Streptococcus pneumoniae]|nr:hypothetical protein [Streptococcus pneumoniae]